MRNELLSNGNRRDGVALVIVLSFLVLITVLVLAFFSSVSTELVGAKTSVNTLGARSLANSTTEIVKGIIQQATREGAWASQPGMIRTWDGSGKPGKFFRLYSSNNMVFDGAGFTPGSDLDKKWADKPAVFTDLNAPAMVPNPDKPSEYQTLFPIVDPRAQGDVEGFAVKDTSYGAVLSKKDDARLPMPVQWIYVLEDGTLTTPDPASGVGDKPATFDTAVVTRSNPIVGRIAFWTDDESCKVNINTASEGTYWDVPRIWGEEDIRLARYQPAQREYQTYPGHPATVSLSPVFSSLLGKSSLDTYYEMTPRVNTGGSLGGTVAATKPITPDGDRLYTSVDELLFRPKRTLNPLSSTKLTPEEILERARFFLTANSRAPEVNMYNLPRISMWPVWNSGPATGYDVTSSSPTNTNNGKDWRTATDNLLAFAATMGKQPFYFQRSNARSTTQDWTGIQRNQKLYNYLKALTDKPVPGFGGSFAQKFKSGRYSDRDQILTSIFDYIRCTNLADTTGLDKNGRPIRGATPATPYTPPFNTQSRAGSPGAGEVFPIRIGNTSGFGRFLTISEAAIVFSAADGTTGANAVTSQLRATLVLELTSPMQGYAADWPKLKHRITGLDKLTVDVGGKTLNLNFSSRNPDQVNTFESAGVFTFNCRSTGGLEGFLIPFMTDTNISYVGVEAHAKVTKTGPSPGTFDGKGGIGHYPFVSQQNVVLDPPVPVPDSPTKWSESATFDFSGGPIKIEILGTKDDGSDEVIQTLNLDFPKVTGVRMPVVPVIPGQYFDKREADLGWRLNGWNQNAKDFGNVFRTGDTIISLEPAGTDASGANGGGSAESAAPKADRTAGDIRMIAGLNDVPKERFRAHNDYTITNQNNRGAYLGKAHSLLTSEGVVASTHGAKMARLATSPGGNWGNRRWNVPSRVDPTTPTKLGVTRMDGGPGDWDTGAGLAADGPYINKPDEGESASTTAGKNARIPYLEGDLSFAPPGQTFFSPNRQIPSPMMLGSIPTGVQRMLPWQTLLFQSKPEDTKKTHPGFGTPASGPPYTMPPDHLLADLFWMPVVEPYAISEPFSTMGKINMNYQIVPFTYIRRDTGVRAVMKATHLMGINSQDSDKYKPHVDPLDPDTPDPTPTKFSKRYEIDAQKTLDVGFEEAKFNARKEPDIFRSATQICEVDLYPAGGGTNLTSFWTNNALTGDNLREKPYVDMYGRLTTKSNAYTIHVKAESLKKSLARGTPDSDPRWAQWDEAKDQVLGEYRGSSIIERYIDPGENHWSFMSFIDKLNLDFDLNVWYRYRTVNTKQFGQ